MNRFTRWLRRVLRLPCAHEWGASSPVTEVWDVWNAAANKTDRYEVTALAQTCVLCGEYRSTQRRVA